MRIFLLTAGIILLVSTSNAQKGITNVGIQYKPIIPAAFLGTGTLINDAENIHFETALKSGFSAGIVVRHNFTNLLAFETGINYVKRKYTLSIIDGSIQNHSTFRIIGYEIPAVLMVYAQLGEKIFINGSMGPMLDMFASNVQTFDSTFNHVAFRNHVFQPAISANAGCEYRTESSGTFYLGASFQRPFKYIYQSVIGYYGNNNDVVVGNELSGSYLTIDLRYFFPVTNPKKVSAD